MKRFPILSLVVLFWAAGCATSPFRTHQVEADFGNSLIPEAVSVGDPNVSSEGLRQLDFTAQAEETVNARLPDVAVDIQTTNSFRVATGASVATGAIELKPRLVLEPNSRSPNEAVSGKLLFSGAVIEAVKSGNPLQLLNPFAGPSFSPEDNVLRELRSGEVYGLKVFSIGF
jgi:hypothetical protein